MRKQQSKQKKKLVQESENKPQLHSGILWIFGEHAPFPAGFRFAVRLREAGFIRRAALGAAPASLI